MSDYQIAVAASAERDENAASSTKINRGGKGVIVAVTTTAGTGTDPSVTVKLQGYVNGTWYDIPGAATAAITNMDTTTVLTVALGITAVTNVAVSQPLPRIWRAYWTIGGTDTPTVSFSIDATIIQ